MASRKRSLSDMQTIPLHEEYSDHNYCREVLDITDGVTESAYDDQLVREAGSLGIEITLPAQTHISLCDSIITIDSRHARNGSTDSNASDSSTATSVDRSSGEDATPRRGLLGRSRSFSEYDRFAASTEPAYLYPVPAHSAPSLGFSASRKSISSIRIGLKSRFGLRRNKASLGTITSCVCCRDDFSNYKLHALPCTHKYCEKCLQVLIHQATIEESKMPPNCCNRAIPGCTIKTVLNREEQTNFMKSVLQFSTPWEARIFCPAPTCGAFIPPRTKIDPKHPATVTCQRCRTKACSTCKREAHVTGQDCPSDWELEAVLKMGESAGWRRCYKCRTLVELIQGCSHITCRCKAQFCYICGAVWDPDIGCPNYCSGEEELERRRAEEEARAACLAAEIAAQEEEEARNEAKRIAARKRTQESEVFQDLRKVQVEQKERFIDFERKMKWLLWTRHGQSKLEIIDKYGELQSKMTERHAKTSAHLDDRQVAAEMELRTSLKQAERSVKFRLRHMEAYCNGLCRSEILSSRVVTEQDLRELGQQYNIRDDLDRLHQARINVMRDKQAKQMEQLVERQEEELKKLRRKQNDELESLEESFAEQEGRFRVLFRLRRQRLRERWKLQGEVLRKKAEVQMGLEFGPMEPLEWLSREMRDANLDVVAE